VFPASVQEKAQRVINNYTSRYTAKRGRVQNLQIIGVHIRRGDYQLPRTIKYGYIIVTKTYIDNAFQYFRTRCDNTCLFLVFTGTGKEDIKWREENIKGDDVLNVVANPRDIYMCALSMCNHTIITIGSLGWWSAWLANGTTVYFKDVAKQNSYLRKDFSKDMSDFFLPSWVGLE
jgi:galactoside 2-L-fucosyltransferase 1/2